MAATAFLVWKCPSVSMFKSVLVFSLYNVLLDFHKSGPARKIRKCDIEMSPCGLSSLIHKTKKAVYGRWLSQVEAELPAVPKLSTLPIHFVWQQISGSVSLVGFLFRGLFLVREPFLVISCCAQTAAVNRWRSKTELLMFQRARFNPRKENIKRLFFLPNSGHSTSMVTPYHQYYFFPPSSLGFRSKDFLQSQ